MLRRRLFPHSLPALFFCVLTLLLGWQPLQAQEGLVRVTLLQLNDVYQISAVDKGTRGGLARVATLRKKVLAESPHTLFLLGGDTISPSVASRIFKGHQMVVAWNTVGLDYAVLGNHEFDFGDAVLKERMQESRFGWLAANVIDKQTNKPFGNTPPYVIREIAGVKLALFGLLTPDTAQSSKPGPNVEFRDPIKTARQLVNEMRANGAQVVIALTHLPMSQDKELARNTSIDVIIGGHEHALLQSLSAGTPIFKMGSDARQLGRIDLNIDPATGSVESIDWEVIPVTSDIPEDAAVATALADFEKKLAAELDKPIGKSNVVLDARQFSNRSRETNLGDFIADAYRKHTGADVAILNGGSIRSNATYGPGPLTPRDIISILPFENAVVKVEVTGAQLRAALEHGVSRVAEDKEEGRFPQVSGLQFSFDGRRPAGSRVVGITVDGKPLDEKKSYTLASSQYLLAGGDGYTLFREVKYLLKPEEGPLDSAVVINAITAVESIAPQTDGRIKRVDQ